MANDHHSSCPLSQARSCNRIGSFLSLFFLFFNYILHALFSLHLFSVHRFKFSLLIIFFGSVHVNIIFHFLLLLLFVVFLMCFPSTSQFQVFISFHATWQGEYWMQQNTPSLWYRLSQVPPSSLPRHACSNWEELAIDECPLWKSRRRGASCLLQLI